MIRILLAALIAFTFTAPSIAGSPGDGRSRIKFVTPLPAFPQPKNGTITLRYMPGGVVGEHMIWAKVWADMKLRIIIADDQYSAAAMMAVRLKQNGARICAKKGADLYFHLLSDGSHPSRIVGHAKTIGPLTHRFKRISPAAFGIKACN
jgi:hypothetical protein